MQVVNEYTEEDFPLLCTVWIDEQDRVVSWPFDLVFMPVIV